MHLFIILYCPVYVQLSNTMLSSMIHYVYSLVDFLPANICSKIFPYTLAIPFLIFITNNTQNTPPFHHSLRHVNMISLILSVLYATCVTIGSIYIGKERKTQWHWQPEQKLVINLMSCLYLPQVTPKMRHQGIIL